MESSQADRDRSQEERPPLTPDLSLDDFHNYYWYLRDLVTFCREHGLPTTGQKADLLTRVEAYLRGDLKDVKPDAVHKRTKRSATVRTGPITIDTLLTDEYKCDAETRAFFKSVIGDHFHFTAHMQQFRRDQQRKGVTLTYGDLAREWEAEQERRKDKNYKSRIARAWQYNQFVRDFMADRERNRGKTIADAAKAWNAIRAHRGPHSYAEYVRLELDEVR